MSRWIKEGSENTDVEYQLERVRAALHPQRVRDDTFLLKPSALHTRPLKRRAGFA